MAPEHRIRDRALVESTASSGGDHADAGRVAVGISVVIPARNEADNIAWVLRRIPSYVDEVVIVDGRSTDATIAVARMVRPDVVVVTDNGLGKGDAMRVGAKMARGSIVVMMDADGSMDPAEIERFVEPLAQDFDFVKGSRFLAGGGTSDMTTLRKAGHWALLTLANVMYGSRWSDLCYGFCAFRRSALDELALDADGFEIETQMVVRSARIQLRITEVPSYEYPRRFGNSQLNTFRDGWRVLCTIFQERVKRHPVAAIDEPGMADELIDA
ncbi:MAG TPA: glycosyltransferase family 2 protein [Candidatus Dormibacteraeota bacterium]|nr:glycosyltransferase family 2 protein [Candidatus Dormibacteraeota bacterium]